MKKLVVLLCVLFLALGLNAEVYLPILAPYQTLALESFRHQATTAIEDDLDDGIDGTDIFAVKGARIYTNLSNLASSWETQADNSNSENTLVIGAISPIYKGWKAALFYGNANVNQSASGTATEVEFRDIDPDAAFDWTSVLNSDTSFNQTNNENCILVNIGRIMGEETQVAFTYKRTIQKSAGDYSVSEDYTETDIDGNDILEYWENDENYEGETSVPISLYSLSYTKPFMNWNLRGDAYLYMGAMNNNSNDIYRYFEDYSPADPTETDDRLDTTLTDYQDDISGNLAGISLLLSDENEQTGLLWEVGGNLGMVFGSGDYNELSRYSYRLRGMIGGDVSVYDTVDNIRDSGPISLSGTNMGLNGRIEWQISPNVRWGIGLLYNKLSATLEYDLDYLATITASYDDGDGVDEYVDYTRTGIEGGSYLQTMKLSTNNIVIPTGIELNFGKNKDWFLRLGALANGSTNEITYSDEVDEASIQRDSVRVEHGDGTVFAFLDTDIDYTDEETTITYTTQTVDFVYGLGWKPSPNLSLDLLGMFDLGGAEFLSTDWFKSLRLSATINVY
jgi:hypothetical protein